MIADNISKMIGEAMKAKEEVRLSTLKLLGSALNYEFIAKQHKLTEEEEIVVIKHEAKKRKEAIEAYEKVGAKDRADLERKELVILQEFMPPEMPDAKLKKIVDEVMEQMGILSMSDMGRVMGQIMARVKGQVDGNRVSALVKEKLTAK